MKRLVLHSILVTSLSVMLLGCPGSNPTAIALGLWLMDESENDGFFAFELLPGGEVDELNSTPIGASFLFSPDVTWTQNGSTITLRQEANSMVILYTGTLQSLTFFAGEARVEGEAIPLATFQASRSPEL